MSEPTNDRSPPIAGSDEELLAALADEFAVRARAGEHPTVEEYVTRHPALAERIRKVLSAVAMIEQSRPVGFSSAAEGAGSLVGRYRLLERIGEGGFGVVYMAEQQHPVRRKVALKIVKLGMDSRQILARFEAEQQALAMMNHENIARVLDAGVTESGRPYFVMELVKGEPITEFCDHNQLAPNQRLELFIQVCDAVQHAHQKGIIHRDIKPSNVLVAMHDTKPVIKVIDFGVAKALGQELTERTLFTGFAQLIGTPLYMSPEQAGQSALDVDTRSDIYSLGVLLYELLTGTTPFQKERFRQAAQDEIRRIIREEEPPRPSTRLSESKDSLPSISAQRNTEPAKLARLVRGELDWIVMKALEKDRSRRYETANGLARDVDRYLHDEPVTAGPPSAAYRARKYARKYRKVLLTAAAFMVLLVAATITSLALASWALRERNRVQEQKRSAEANFKRALQAVDQMLTRVGQDQLSHLPQMELVRRELLRDALRFYQEFLLEQTGSTLVRAETARAYRRVGDIQSVLGQHDESEAAYQQSIALLEKLLADNRGDASFLNELGGAHRDLGVLYQVTRRWPQAEAELQQCVALLEQTALEHPTFLRNSEELAKCFSDMVATYRQMGRLDEAESSFRKGSAVLDRLLALDRDNVAYLKIQARSYNNVALVYGAQGRTSDAVAILHKAVALNQQLVRAQPGAVEARRLLSGCYNNLGLFYARQGEHEQAEAAYRESLAIKEATLRDYPNVILYMVDLAGGYGNIAIEVRRRSPEESLEWTAKAIAIHESILEKDARYVEARMGLFDSLMSRAYAQRRLEHLDAAAKDWRRAIEISEGHPHINMRLYRPLILTYLGEHARAAEECEALVAEGLTHGPNLTLFASAYSLGSTAAARDERLQPAEREVLTEKYGARAVELLRQAAEAGYFRLPDPLQELREQNDFDAIRSRPDFQALLAEVEKSALGMPASSTAPDSL